MTIRIQRYGNQGKVAIASAVRATLSNLTEGALQGVRDIFHRNMEEVVENARDLVPVDSGALQSTIGIKEETVQPGKVQVKAGFGGVAEGTWVSRNGRVREDPNVNSYASMIHETHRTGSKFFEIPFDEQKPKIDKEVREFLRKAPRLYRKGRR